MAKRVRRLAPLAPPLLLLIAAAAGGLVASGSAAPGAILLAAALLAMGAVCASHRRRRRALHVATRFVREFGRDRGAPPPGEAALWPLGPLGPALAHMAKRVRVAEQRAATSEKRTRDLLDTMSEGLVVVDGAERVKYANPAFARMLRAPHDGLAGLELTCFLEPAEVEKLLAETRRRREGRAGRYELVWRRVDGERLVSFVSAQPVLDARGRYRGSFAVVTDLTELRALQREMNRRERFQALGELAGGIAHDFNNRLAAILGNAQLALLDLSGQPLERPLRVIEKCAMEGAETVRRILEFTRRRHELEREELDANILAAEVVGLLSYREEIRSSSIRVERKFEATRPISGSGAEIREALLNILLNALDAMPRGGLLGVEAADHPAGVAYRVTDVGEGMTRETLERAFDPFFTTRGTRRTGLGLPLAFGIVRRHGGRLRIRSSPGRGTVVLMVLPALAVGVPRVRSPRAATTE